MTVSDSQGNTQDEELLADLFDSLLQEILEGRTPDIDAVHPDRPDLRDRIAKTWSLACSVAGRREPSRPVFGGYEILRELGHGGMGTVYLARHQTLQREVAVKVLPQSLAMSPRAKQRFVEEARSLAQLRHENIVHLHRIVDHTEMLAFEMEYIDGPSLQQLVTELRKTDKPHAIESLAAVIGVAPSTLGTHSTVEWFVRLLIKVSRALEEVHRIGLVHRDVKPANILLRKDGSPVLADFGLALQSDLDPQNRKFAGTPVYAAPERLRGNDLDVSPVADVYSLGVTLHEVLTLNPPFQGSTTDEVLRRIESGNVIPLRQQAPHISRDLATIVSKAMELDPRHRYAKASDLADDLERLLKLQPIHAQPAGPVRRAVKFVRRHQKAFVAATCGAAMVALVSWPLAVIAAEASANQKRATAAQHLARTVLLCQESLPPWWQSNGGDNRVVKQSSSLVPRRASLERALGHYGSALRATPDDVRLQHEAAAVRAAANAIGATPSSTGSPAAFVAGDTFSDGLYAFLTGDRSRHQALWQDLPSELLAEPFIDACMALGIATEGRAGQAYPRVFHAARAFPNATALVVAMAEGALRSGDVPMAKRWFDAIPTDVALLDVPRRLLAAGLMVAEGKTSDALTSLRQISRVDPSDPRPLLSIVQIALSQHDLDAAGRVCRSILQRWPNLHQARCQLAYMALLRRKLSEYLGYVQDAMRHSGSTSSEVAELLQLGGLRAVFDNQINGRIPGTASVPLKTFLPGSQVRGVERALDLLPTLHAIADTASHVDPRPIGATICAISLAALRFPDLTSNLPLPAQLALGTLTVLRAKPTLLLSELLLPYQTTLGTPFRKFRASQLIPYAERQRGVFYGKQVMRVGDVDGDTLPDLCLAAPPVAGSGEPGFVELRRGDDGTLLTRWQASNADSVYGISIANLGDIDGDFCNDILIGKPLNNTSALEPAAIEARSGRTGQRLWQISDDYVSFGAAIAHLNDTNGDGYRDFVLGSPPLQLKIAGRAWIRSGKDGSILRVLDAPEIDSWFGGTVATAGDVNNDGVEDVLVGGNYGNAKGLVVVFDGKTGDRLLTVTDDDPNSQFGQSLAAVGDIDHDSYGDFAIAAPGASSNSVVMISGRTGKSIYELRGERANDQFGAALCVMPDWRADGRPAIAISSRRGGPSGSGSVRVFDLENARPLQTFSTVHGMFGYALVDLEDRNGDGLRDLGIMTLSPLNQTSLWVMSFADCRPSDTATDGR